MRFQARMQTRKSGPPCPDCDTGNRSGTPDSQGSGARDHTCTDKLGCSACSRASNKPDEPTEPRCPTPLSQVATLTGLGGSVNFLPTQLPVARDRGLIQLGPYLVTRLSPFWSTVSSDDLPLFPANREDRLVGISNGEADHRAARVSDKFQPPVGDFRECIGGQRRERVPRKSLALEK